ncbi:MAG: hypothetical protein ACK55J_00205, partial [Alphaproteobacteria bacterium]
VDNADQRRKPEKPGGNQIPENGGSGHNDLPDTRNAPAAGCKPRLLLLEGRRMDIILMAIREGRVAR